MINDHSNDQSEQIVTHYRKQDKRLGVLASPRKGLVAALNFGLQAAKGKFIARIDADDRMRPDRLRLQVEALEMHTSWSLVACQVHLFPEQSIQAGYREYIRWQNQCLTPTDIDADIYLESPFMHPSVTYRRADILKLGGYCEGDFAEDYDLCLRMHQAGPSMAKLPEILLDWRDSPRRLSRIDPRCSQQAFGRLRALPGQGFQTEKPSPPRHVGRRTQNTPTLSPVTGTRIHARRLGRYRPKKNRPSNTWHTGC